NSWAPPPPTGRAARSLASPSDRARRHRATASRLLSASIFGVFAPRRRDAARPLRIQWEGRPKTCMGGLLRLLIRNSQLRRPLLLFQTDVSYLSEPGQGAVRRPGRRPRSDRWPIYPTSW